jgi:hypothetical protein
MISSLGEFSSYVNWQFLMHLQKFDYSLKQNNQLNVSVQNHDLNKIIQSNITMEKN